MIRPPITRTLNFKDSEMDLFPQVEPSEIDFKKWKVYVPNSEMDLFSKLSWVELISKGISHSPTSKTESFSGV